MLNNKYFNYILKSCLQYYPYTHDNQLQFRTHEVQCLSHDGRMINFLPAKQISAQIQTLTLWLEDKQDQAKSSDDILAHWIGTFWITFIAIHPFPDHNGKIAKQTIRFICQDFGRNISLDSLLDQFLIEGNPQNDLENLKKIILQALKFEAI